MSLGLVVLAYDLGNFPRRFVLPRKIKYWSLRTLLVKLIEIGAKVLRYSRYVMFQMAEPAIRNPSILQNTVLGMNYKPKELRIYSFVVFIFFCSDAYISCSRMDISV